MSQMPHITPKFLVLLLRIYNRLLKRLKVTSHQFIDLTYISLKVLSLLRKFLDVNILERHVAVKTQDKLSHGQMNWLL